MAKPDVVLESPSYTRGRQDVPDLQVPYEVSLRPTSPLAALLAGYTTNKHIVDESSAHSAIAETTTTN